MSKNETHHGDLITCIKTAKKLYTSSLDHTIRIWDNNLKTDKVIAEKKHRGIQHFVPLDNSIVIMSIDGEITVFDQKNETFSEFSVMANTSCKFDCSEDFLVYQSQDSSVITYNSDKNIIHASFQINVRLQELQIVSKDIYLANDGNSLILINNNERSMTWKCNVYTYSSPYLILFHESRLEIYQKFDLIESVENVGNVRQIVHHDDKFLLVDTCGDVKSLDVSNFEISPILFKTRANSLFSHQNSIHLVQFNHIHCHGDPYNGYNFRIIHHHFVEDNFWILHHSNNVHYKIGAVLIDYFVDSKNNIFELKRCQNKVSFQKVKEMEPCHPTMNSTDLKVFWIDSFQLVVYSTKSFFSKFILMNSLEMMDIPFDILSISMYKNNLYMETALKEQIVWEISSRRVLDKIQLKGPLERIIWNEKGQIFLFEKHIEHEGKIYHYFNVDRCKIMQVYLIGSLCIFETVEGFHVEERFHPDVNLVIKPKSLDFKEFNHFEFENKKWTCVGKSMMTMNRSNSIRMDEPTSKGRRKIVNKM